MKKIIVYATKTGTTQKCAEMISKRLNDVKIIDLSNETPDISSFDIIVVAGSVRMGLLNKRTRKFIKENKALLKDKKTFYFICNGMLDQTQDIIKNNFDLNIIESAEYIDTFGGELRLDKIKGLDKLIIKMVLKSNKNSKITEPKILIKNIEKFADKINECERKYK